MTPDPADEKGAVFKNNFRPGQDLAPRRCRIDLSGLFQTESGGKNIGGICIWRR